LPLDRMRTCGTAHVEGTAIHAPPSPGALPTICPSSRKSWCPAVPPLPDRPGLG
jgi:hypothetical protein